MARRFKTLLNLMRYLDNIVSFFVPDHLEH
jgi:hypothetical protein